MRGDGERMKDHANILIYARDELGGGSTYDGYQPHPELLKRVAALRPTAQLVVVSAAWSEDCRREVPRFARILERLPGWTAELRGDDAETRAELHVSKIPTFIVRDADSGEELGRIVETPESDRLEGDLLAIAERHPSRIIA